MSEKKKVFKKIEREQEETGQPVAAEKCPLANKIPKSCEIEWHDYVLSHLDESEFFEGVPRMDGMRRLVEALVSPITKIDSYIQVIASTNYPIVIVTATITLGNGTIYSASSDASYYSVAPAFRNRLTAIADNRAKAKAYREILRLGNMSTSEEVSSSPDLDDQEDMVATQKSLILRKVKELNLNLERVCQELYGRLFDNLTHSQAGNLIKKLSDWGGKREEIPKQFIGEKE